MIKVATSNDFIEINNRRKIYLNTPDLTEIPIEEKTICVFDDASNDFLLAELADLGEKTPQSNPFWVVQCFTASLGNIRPIIKEFALELQRRNYTNTSIFWPPQKNLLREAAVKNLLAPREKFINNRKFWEYTASETLAKI